MTGFHKKKGNVANDTAEAITRTLLSQRALTECSRPYAVTSASAISNASASDSSFAQTRGVPTEVLLKA